MDKKLWYKLLGKDDALNRSLYYKINEKFDPSDSPEHEIDLGGNKKFYFNKNTKKVFFSEGKKDIMFTINDFRRIFIYAKEKGIVK